MSVEISICETIDQNIVSAFAQLIPQLSSSNPAPDGAALQRIVDHDATTLFLAHLDGRIVGSLTLAVFPIPTGVRAWIEDVVVDEGVRGHGVGEELNRAALERARSLGAITVDLTSRPSREAANRLYKRLGFVERETNVYRFELSD